MNRNPRINPMPGDVIRQKGSGIVLRVKSVDRDLVTWERKTRFGWKFENTWTITGWINIVAKRSTIIESV